MEPMLQNFASLSLQEAIKLRSQSYDFLIYSYNASVVGG
jgi:hypothetical protein